MCIGLSIKNKEIYITLSVKMQTKKSRKKYQLLKKFSRLANILVTFYRLINFLLLQLNEQIGQSKS